MAEAVPWEIAIRVTDRIQRSRVVRPWKSPSYEERSDYPPALRTTGPAKGGGTSPSVTGETAAGSMRSFFRYELDCRDRSFNRIGDVRIPRPAAKGWQPVEYDPTALAVAYSWCPRIQELPPASAVPAVQEWIHPN